MQKKPAYTHIVVVLAWKLSSFQQLPREKPGIWLKLQRTHPKMRSTPQAIPSLPSAAPTLHEHLPTKAHPAPSPTCSCSSAPEALPSQPLPSTSLGCSQMKTNQEGQRQPPLTGRGQMRSELLGDERSLLVAFSRAQCSKSLLPVKRGLRFWDAADACP